jgi:hypothetical protein
MSSKCNFFYLWSNPLLDKTQRNALQDLNLRKERECLKQITTPQINNNNAKKMNVRFHSVVATNNAFRLRAQNAHIIHFSGHGVDGKLAFEHDVEVSNSSFLGSANMHSAEVIYETFKPQLVFVNACHSESIGRSFAAIGVPHVIAIQR